MLRFPRLKRSTALTIDGSSPGSTPASFGPFRVLHQVGAGTTGLVFRAHDQVEGRLVAIKAFRLDLTPERAAELARALQSLPEHGLSHPSIAGPIAAGVEDGIAWFAQAYVPAESLDSALRQYGNPPVADALTIITQLAGALDFAAAAGVLHGSLHPRDVLVAPGETHVVDLGVAAALEACGVRAPVRRPYSAPERGAGRPVSRAGDIFALGAIAFELLSGQPVTGAGDDVVVALPDVPGADREALLETLSFALAVAPDERYATALAFAAPLKRALGDALTRPAAPRKRRTTRPPESLLPTRELASEPPAEPGTAAVPTVESSFDAASFDAFEPVSSGPASWDDAPPPGIPPLASHDQDLVDRASSSPRARDARPAKPIADAAPVYVSGPTEPEPSAPAIERIAEPGEADPLRPAGNDVRFGSLDELGSPLGGGGLNAALASTDRWDIAPDPDEMAPEPPVYVAPGDEGFETPLADRDSRYVHVGHEPNSSPRAPWLALAAMLLVGLVAGVGGGWFLFGGRGERPAATAGAGPPADARPREYTDDSVRGPAESAPKQTAPAQAAAAAPSRSAPEARAAAVPPASAAAGRPETAARGRLTVRTRPTGARVEIGGRSRGESPATVTDLAYGRHVVRVSHEGYVTEQRRVTLSARQPAQTVDVTLKRTTPPAPARASGQSDRFVGTVVVESRPAGAKVFVDGKGMGVTPVTIPDVRVGSHVVRLELLGHRRWSTSVRVVSGERERVAASLEEETVP